MTIRETPGGPADLPPGELLPVAEAEAAAADVAAAGSRAPAADVEPSADTSRRRKAARGVVINSGFMVALGGLNLVKSLIVVGFVTAADFGVWSIVLLALLLVVAVKSVAVGDKYIQQQEADQALAFQRAFTLELIAAGLATLAMAALAPILALVYDRGELLAPALALALVLPGMALQAPIWVFYRKLDFFRQRLLMAVDPLVGLVVTIVLAVAGLGYWSLVIGLIAGSWAAGALAIAVSPYPLALRYERATMREYFRFSLPLMISVGLGLMIAQFSVFFGELALGLAGAGAIGLAGTFAAYSERVDSIVTQTIYPIICRVRDRRDLMHEAFVKSNRLALMWAVPFGISLTLFVPDLVEYGIGSEWDAAVPLLQVVGITAAVNHIGFNWGAFYRAAGITRPIGIVTGLALATFLAVVVPLLFAYELDGFAAGLAVMTVVSLTARWYFITKLFPGIEVAWHMGRAILPTVPAVAAVLLVRLVYDGDRSGELALAELGLYAVVTVIATLVIERALIREVLGYLRRRRPATMVTAESPG